MKYLSLLMLLTFIACGSGNPSESTSDSTTTASNTIISTETNNGGIPTYSASERTQIDAQVSEPIKGGPLDVTIKFVDAPQVSKTVKLIGSFVDQNYIADTARMVNGIVNFKKEEGLAQGLYFVEAPFGGYLQLIMDEDQQFNVELNSKDIIGTIKVKGSKDNLLYYETAKYEANVNPKLQSYATQLKKLEKGSEAYEKAKKGKLDLEASRARYVDKLLADNPTSLFANFKASGQNPAIREDLPADQQVSQYRRDFWEMFNFQDRRLLYTPMVGNKLKRYFEELTPNNPDSIKVSADLLVQKSAAYPDYYKTFTNWIVKKFEPTKTKLMDSEAVFVHMIQNYFTYDKAFWQDSAYTQVLQTRAYEMSNSLIGGDAPDVKSTDVNGNTVSLLDKTADYLVVYMFNPDCEHCQEQTPKLIDYYNQNKNEVDVFAIAIETEDKLWKDYVKKMNFPFTSVYDPTNRSIYAKYYVDITPELYVINPDRKIIGKNLKVFQIQTVIDRDKENRGN